MTDRKPVFDQLNLVVRDMAAMVQFYERLGVEFGPTFEPWDRHHRSVADGSVIEGFDLDLDSQRFAGMWNEGWPAGQTGAVLTFRLPSREAVDETHADLTAAGYSSQQSPYDAFFGARYAVVVDPDGNSVALISPVEPARQSAPPDPDA